ncbi:MAG TPA: DUF4870 domain-containing protein [Chloroflexi bacterium]|jgi:uncharacterized membrane protein|nr:DUF4870 domain-containing protein [Chloroflexota bacterium]
MSEEPFAPAPSSNEKLLAALCYPLFPIISIFILLVEEHKNNAYERYHALQALGAGIVVWVLVTILSTILGITVILALCVPFLWILGFVPLLYWGYQAYQGKEFEVPFVTKFMKNQNWL